MKSKKNSSAHYYLVAIATLFFHPLASRLARADAFVETGDMKRERWWFSAALLPDGRVLAAGGVNLQADAVMANSELYDPATGQWTETSPMIHARALHSTTLLESGKVLVIGGIDFFNNDVPLIANSELYDPATDQWTETGAFLTPRGKPTATLLMNGKVLVAGGVINPDSGETTAEAELYDPASGQWTRTGALPTNLDVSVSTRLADGRVLFAGGRTKVGATNLLSLAELYDPSSGTWSATGPIATARNGHISTLLPDGRVLIAGGVDEQLSTLSSAELYNPATGTWTMTGSMNVARVAPTAHLLANGRVLVTGGFDQITNEAFDSAELYDPMTGEWSMAASMTEARYDDAAVLLLDGRVLVIGGDNSVVSFASTELYLPDDKATPSIRLISPRVGPGGGFQFNFTETPGGQFTLLATSDLALPLAQWTALPGITEPTPGKFEAIDTGGQNSSKRFYVIRKP